MITMTIVTTTIIITIIIIIIIIIIIRIIIILMIVIVISQYINNYKWFDSSQLVIGLGHEDLSDIITGYYYYWVLIIIIIILIIIIIITATITIIIIIIMVLGAGTLYCKMRWEPQISTDCDAGFKSNECLGHVIKKCPRTEWIRQDWTRRNSGEGNNDILKILERELQARQLQSKHRTSHPNLHWNQNPGSMCLEMWKVCSRESSTPGSPGSGEPSCGRRKKGENQKKLRHNWVVCSRKSSLTLVTFFFICPRVISDLNEDIKFHEDFFFHFRFDFSTVNKFFEMLRKKK